ncbi:methyltransferase [Renibacterium salmoninarum ATCC 33209]|uniref:Ribosomal RNA small subunit methyltransferase G n=1 Tax=Renibacterium salmoninarum (strain ATCC 33209 / DSM 20767 / JCM 11484 / NBRC 15589 / NCIMB 2235) TaxID=288705 RepID=RSMG_RENSM|nr:16S rRNA (guanine(527)-N(7))-methyltransferase RsmG [Renibacterium salmoninarum]A9WVP1.1 RecName: Full=Ribosomal RNA small subunit methyltransferase G; AltName: Full=16S rRNA 7-methylguanosine methyltransferase; Short=16S rRNA m7G methyltransferase [Renibacterium salmoninarum ATCC 33209]ABY25262.1 methyltransferase [Renibacterium salmoninarum ATCC 33209]
MLEMTEAVASAAHSVFGDRLPLAQRYVEHLATSGIERGLIGPREVPRLWDRHVLNCAVVVELIEIDATVADVGSGAGLPGLCLALARPDLSITLIEPLERRVTWLSEVVADLGLSDQVTLFRMRAEQAVDEVNCSVVTARAVSALDKLAGLTIPLLHGNGQFLAVKGRSAAEEITKAAKAVRKLGGTRTDVLVAGSSVLEEPTTVVRILVGSAHR